MEFVFKHAMFDLKFTSILVPHEIVHHICTIDMSALVVMSMPLICKVMFKLGNTNKLDMD